MKKILIFTTIVSIVFGTIGCKKWVDINSDPDTPQFPDPSSVLPAQLAAIPRGLQYDARYAGRFVQNWGSSSAAATSNSFDRMGYTAASDANGDIWRQAYYGMGKNLNYIIDQGIKNGQKDYVGVAYALKAMIFQYCTDYHGEIIFYEAFRENQTAFKYDDQESVYRGIDSLCRLAINYLSDPNISTGAQPLSKGDFSFNGDKAKWLKFTYGILARNFHRFTNKSVYNADSVIFYCDKSMNAVTDDFLIPFDATRNDDANFFGTFRDNLTSIRQSSFIVKLLDGTILANTTPTSLNAYLRDPRLKHMLSASHDTTNGNGGYRGVDAGAGDPYIALANWWTYAPASANYINARKKIATPWGDTTYANPTAGVFSTQYQKYLFGNKSPLPVMTASEIQFMKAEAAYKKSDLATAHTAYIKGINLHFDFINRATLPRGGTTLFNGAPIPDQQRNDYLASANVKQTAGALTLSDIMLQKYIALWGWGFFETFVDMRRYHWTDLDPVTGLQVYNGFTLPSPISSENLNKPVYRVRPRYNSEYVWNRPELLRIGALNGDYHTYEPWFIQP